MKEGIAILLRGDHTDLVPSLYAVEFAKRTGHVLHAVFTNAGNGSKGGAPEPIQPLGDDDKKGVESFKTATWLGEMEGIKVSCHMLSSNSDETLVQFLRIHNISFVITGGKDDANLKKTSEWLAAIRAKLGQDDRWYGKSFWVLVMQCEQNDLVEQLLGHYERSRQGPGISDQKASKWVRMRDRKEKTRAKAQHAKEEQTCTCIYQLPWRA